MQHHAHYKCTLYYSERTFVGWPIPHMLEDSDSVEVIYIDHNHLHMVGDVEGGPELELSNFRLRRLTLETIKRIEGMRCRFYVTVFLCAVRSMPIRAWIQNVSDLPTGPRGPSEIHVSRALNIMPTNPTRSCDASFDQSRGCRVDAASETTCAVDFSVAPAVRALRLRVHHIDGGKDVRTACQMRKKQGRAEVPGSNPCQRPTLQAENPEPIPARGSNRSHANFRSIAPAT